MSPTRKRLIDVIWVEIGQEKMPMTSEMVNWEG